MRMKPTIYAVATTHLDTSWSWTLETTIGEYLPKTVRDNAELFKKYPGYRFSFEGILGRCKFVRNYAVRRLETELKQRFG